MGTQEGLLLIQALYSKVRKHGVRRIASMLGTRTWRAYHNLRHLDALFAYGLHDAAARQR